MGKASSSKKVARAAKSAGRAGTGRSYAWPLAIGGVVLAGVLLIVFSRGNTDVVAAPRLGDHWHAAYGVYDCSDFLPPFTDQVPDSSGLHTHADGLMHMHPFGTRYTGSGANIGNFGETVGLEVTDTSYTTAGVERKNGDSCGDLGEGILQLKVWDGPDDPEGRLIESDFADYAPQEFSLWTLAFVPEGTEIPKPPPERIEALRAPVDVVGPASTIPPPVTIDPEGETPEGDAPEGETSEETGDEPPETTVPDGEEPAPEESPDTTTAGTP
ncbi:MAG TPA: hypothetical protein VM262_09775 [Acidimicrobiales bacterium]|nr:hypothetical protein [Acidimicrobiales bacterium]